MIRTALAIAAAVVTIAACGSAATSIAGATSTAGAGAGKSSKPARTKSGNVSTAAGAGSTLESLTAGGKTFRYVLHVPSGPGTAKLPLVINLHGGNGTGQSEEELTGMDAVADQGKFIVAYPDQYTAKDIKTLIKVLEAGGRVDPARVYLTGISRGGVYTELLGCKLAGQIAGIAPVAGPLAAGLVSRCSPARPLPVLLISGTADPIVPYTGGRVNSTAAKSAGITLGSAQVESAVATMSFWRKADGCAGAVTSTALPYHGPSDGTTTTVISGAACASGTRVTLYRVNGGGHTWPGGSATERTAAVARIVGKTTDTFSASQVIWAFFKNIAG